MGYSTQFEGELKFTTELTATQLGKVNSFFGEDCRDHPEWVGAEGLYGVDLELLKDFSGLRWNGAEKTCGLVQVINMIVMNMREQWPNFGLKGKMLAQGDEVGDLWELVIGDDGLAYKRKVAINGSIIECPHCCSEFLYRGK